MTYDPDIFNLLAYQGARHAETGFNTDMDTLPGELDCAVMEADASRLNGTDLHVKRNLTPLARREDIAHELAHKIMREKTDPRLPSYEDVIRYRHASVSDIHAHIEAIVTTGQNALLMPDNVVKAIINICGLNARAVWVLHQQQEVYLHHALRRIVEFNENARIGGFIAKRGRITHAYSYRYRMPVWVSFPMPNPDDDFHGEGVSLFQVPGLPEVFIGLIVIEE